MFKDLKSKVKFSNKDIYLMSSVLYMESKAGINLTDTLEGLVSNFSNEHKKNILEKIKSQIMQGKSFSEALKNSSNMFTNEFITLVEGGESSGNMEFVFKTLKQYYDEKIKIERKIKEALTYPIFLFVIFNICIIVLLGFVIYRFQDLLTALDVKKDIKLNMVFNISSFVNRNISFSIVFLISIYLGLYYLIKTLKIYRYIPITNKIINLKHDMFMIKLIWLLYESGVALREILRNVILALDDEVHKNLVIDINTHVINGYPLWKAFYVTGYFPIQIVNVMQSGEKSGALGEALKFIDEILNENLNRTTQKFITLIQPIMIICFACIILLFFITIILPIFNNMGSLGL